MKLIDGDDLCKVLEEAQNLSLKMGKTSHSKYRETYAEALENVRKVVQNRSPIDANPVTYGHWIPNWIPDDDDLDGYWDGYKCSICDEVLHDRPTNYCPDCGAKMNGGD